MEENKMKKEEGKGVEVDINKIKPDPNQPRTIIEDEDLESISKSIITSGVINAIEVDKNFTIVTGERRWRAAKKAGLKTVPVKFIEIYGINRFERQVIENANSKTMNDYDMANALNKLLSLLAANKDGYDEHQKNKNTPLTGPTADKGITRLAERTGIKRVTIAAHLSLLGQSKKWIESVRTKKVEGKFTAPLASTPIEYKGEVEKKLLKNEFNTRGGAREFVAAINREKQNPKVIKELFKTDYSKLTGFHDVENKVAEISPRIHTLISKTFEPSKEITKITRAFREWIIKNPKEKIGKNHLSRIIMNVSLIKDTAEEWLEEDVPRGLLKIKSKEVK